MPSQQHPSPAPYFHDFTKATELHQHNALQFADQVRSYLPTQQLRTLHTASADHALHKPSDVHQRLLTDRKSVREFSSAAVDPEQLGSLLSGLGAVDGRRSFPSAGGLYPLETVVALAHVSGMARHIAVYHPDTHSLGWIADLPRWCDWQSTLGSGVETEPPVTVFFCLDPSAMVEKYGERGGRFALIEVGHAAQVVAERAVVSGLGGYSVGGVLERSTQVLFGFHRLSNPPLPVLAYACGTPESTPNSRPNSKDFERGRFQTLTPNSPLTSLMQRVRNRNRA
jgi:SagB-type dehydrogenase family enzyme